MIILPILVLICGIVCISLISSVRYIYIKKLALFITIAVFYLSLLFWIFYVKQSLFFQFMFYREWLVFMNIDIIFGLDGISIFFIILTTFLFPICVLSSWKIILVNVKEFFLLLLFLESFLLFIFSTLDLILFYIFFESVLIPMVVL